MPKLPWRAQQLQDAASALQLAMLLDEELAVCYDADTDELVDMLLLTAAEPLTKRLKTDVGKQKLSVDRVLEEQSEAAGSTGEWVVRNVSSSFGFDSDDLPRVVSALKVPGVVITRSRHHFQGAELVLLLLRRFRRIDPAHEFTKETGRNLAAISEGLNWLMEHILRTFPHLVDVRSLTCWADQFASFAQSFADMGVPLDNLVGLLDGKVWGTCKPLRNHRFSFNGHKWMYGTKTQGITLANGAPP